MKYAILYGTLVSAIAVSAVCPFKDGGASPTKRQEGSSGKLPGDDGFLDKFVVDDQDVYTTTDFGTPVNDRTSLKAGRRGPTLLEDFVLRTKITRFDHERIPERAGKDFLPPLRRNLTILLQFMPAERVLMATSSPIKTGPTSPLQDS